MKKVPDEVIYGYCDFIEDMINSGEFLEIPSSREFCEFYLEELKDFNESKKGKAKPESPFNLIT